MTLFKNHTPLRIRKKTHYPSFWARVKGMLVVIPHLMRDPHSSAYNGFRFKPGMTILKNLTSKFKNPKSIAILLSGLFVAFLVGIVIRNYISPFFLSKGADPVAIWNMDEGYGTTANDTSGNGNDLTISGATWERSSDRQDAASTALKFDGSDDYASITNGGDFNFGTDSFTLSGWFRHPSTAPSSGSHILIARHVSAGWKIYMDTSGYVCFGVDDDVTWDPDAAVCTTAALGSLADSTWHHVSAVKNSTTSIAIYIDGKLINELTSGIPAGSLN